MRRLFVSAPGGLIWSTLSVFIMLTLAAMACNLTSSDDNPTPVSLAQPIRTNIVSPANDTTFQVRSPITVQVQVSDPDGTGITRVELIANGIVVDQKPSQNPQGDKELIVNLTWDAPTTPGQFTLVVRPYRGQTQGTAATVRVQVVDSNTAATATSSSGGTSGQATAFVPTYDPTCRARIDVNRLNFRSSPDSSNDDNLIGFFLVGDEAPMVGRLGDNSWFRVRALSNPDIIGWIYGPFTTVLGNCNQVPVVNAPATAVPTATATLEPSEAPKADIVALSPSGLSNLQAGVDGTATAIYTFTVQNTGNAATGNFQVIISLPNGDQVTESIPSLEAGDLHNFPQGGLEVKFESPGSHRIFYEADTGLAVDETNEENNVAFLDINVSAP